MSRRKDIIIDANTLLPNKAKKRFRKTNNAQSNTDVIHSLGLSDVMTRARFNVNLRERLSSLISQNTKEEDVYEPINMDELAFFLSLLKGRLQLDGISIYDAIDKMKEREDEFGTFSKQEQTCQSLKVSDMEAFKIGWYPYYKRKNWTSSFRKEVGLNRTETQKDKDRNRKNHFNKESDLIIQDLSKHI